MSFQGSPLCRVGQKPWHGDKVHCHIHCFSITYIANTIISDTTITAIILNSSAFLVSRVLSDVPAQSAGDLVDGLSKTEEEVFFTNSRSADS